MRKSAVKRTHALLTRHGPFYAGGFASVVVVIGLLIFDVSMVIEAAGCVFFAIYLILTAIKLPRLTANYLKSHAAEADEPAALILAVTFAAVVICLVALFRALNAEASDPLFGLVLALASVVLGWLTIHTMAALHYAHMFWRPDGADAVIGGLDFPGSQEPNGTDFLYFAFVIGMTAQTSDVALTTTAMRKVNLVHSVVSFFFNTVLVAAAVNAAVTLAQ